jgi:hypothetical protein
MLLKVLKLVSLEDATATMGHAFCYDARGIKSCRNYAIEMR